MVQKFWSDKQEAQYIDERNKIIEKNFLAVDNLIFNPLNYHWDIWDDRNAYIKKYQYEFNSHLFRSDEFTKNHNGKHILFMGCSETQGCNDGLEDTWAYILYKKISLSEKTSGYFNIAKCGSSIYLQISIFLNYIDLFGIPDEIYFLAPGSDRNLLYSADNKTIEHKSFFLHGEENHERLVNSFSSNVIHMNMFEKICDLLKIKIVWSTWSNQDEDIFVKLPFKNFFTLNMRANDYSTAKYLDKYINPKEDLGSQLHKTDGHRGKAWHNYWAEEFYDQMHNKKS
jgi:hypothetical protein